MLTKIPDTSFQSEVISEFFGVVFYDRIKDLLVQTVDDYYYDYWHGLVPAVGSELVNKSGKIAKRIGRYLHKTHGIKLSNDDLTYIGNQAEIYKAFPYTHYDINDTFDWERGDFGDDGSCFWGGKKAAFVMLRNAKKSYKFFALRFWQNGQGKARCLVAELKNAENKTWILFNFYGAREDYFADVAKKIAGFDNVKIIDLYNRKTARGMLWINGGRGIALSTAPVPFSVFDFHLRDYRQCCECGTFTRDFYEEDDNFYCRDCNGNGYQHDNTLPWESDQRDNALPWDEEDYD